jgi:hypothetical protein
LKNEKKYKPSFLINAFFGIIGHTYEPQSVMIKFSIPSGLYCIVVLLFFHPTYAQMQSEDYILRSDGKKETGVILGSFENDQYNSIRFRSAGGGTSTFGPGDIQGFGFQSGRKFIAMTLPNSEKLQFVQVLLTGKLSLYKSNDKFYVNDGREIHELKAFYDRATVAGKETKELKKPYLGTINMLMAGECSAEIYDVLADTKYDDYSLVKLLSRYHYCEGATYEQHLPELAFMRISPVLYGGMTYMSMSPASRPDNRKDAFENHMTPLFQVGIRAHQFRRWQRLSIDLSVGYSNLDNTVISEYTSESQYMTAKEVFSASSVTVPVFVNYTWTRAGSFDSYVGIGFNSRFTSMESQFAMIDQTMAHNGITTIYETEFTSIKKRMTTAAGKVGVVWNFSKKMGLLAELQLDYLPAFYQINLPFNEASYNQTNTSFLIGLRF